MKELESLHIAEVERSVKCFFGPDDQIKHLSSLSALVSAQLMLIQHLAAVFQIDSIAGL